MTAAILHGRYSTKGTRTNTLSRDVLADFENVLQELESSRPRGLVLRSAKESGFLAGADISEFRNVAEPSEAVDFLNWGHALLDRLEGLDYPTIAVVHGYALGGGFELALACDQRIAVPGASFGFPEVRLGLHPGLGGTFRLPELIDPSQALRMMLTGKSVHTQKALDLGIIKTIVEERHVKAAVASLVAKGSQSKSRSLKAVAFDLAATRKLAAQQMHVRAAEKAPAEHYPAPHTLIDLWRDHGGDRNAMQRAEISSFAKLLPSDTAQNLIRVFFLRERLKKNGAGNSEISHVHIVGAGTMGSEIAALCAIMGLQVTLSDIKTGALGKAVKLANRLAEKLHLSNIEIRDTLDRLMPDPMAYGLTRADLVIEAAPETPDLKRELLVSIEKRASNQAIIASNTSSIELPLLAGVLSNPDRFAGLHFFNPVSKLDLVEVVAHEAASEKTLAALNAFVGTLDHLPVQVASYPGFLVNRILMPYLLEAVLLVEEGYEAGLVDRAAEEFGMPMGPLELADRVGLDICLHVAASLRDNLEKQVADIPAWMKHHVEQNRLGEKSGRGIYAWQDGKPEKSASTGSIPAQIQDRLVLPMLNAAVECLRREVAADEDSLDAAMIFATGFAPFRGGPMHYARQRGTREIVSTLVTFTTRYGERFTPDEGWKGIDG